MRKRLIVGLLLVVLLLQGAAAGSQSDPLVTKGWVDQYIARQIDELSERLENVADSLEGLTIVRLWMGREYLEKNGEQQPLESAPFATAAGRSYVPLRALGEAVGANVSWDNENKRVTYLLDGHRMEMRVGSEYAVADGVTVEIDAPPLVVNSRVFVPVRVVSENLGLAVSWLAAEKCAVITFGE